MSTASCLICTKPVSTTLADAREPLICKDCRAVMRSEADRVAWWTDTSGNRHTEDLPGAYTS